MICPNSAKPGIKPFSQLQHPREVIRQFTPNWFAATMGTGVLALVRERAHLLTPELAASEEASSALRAMLTEGGRVYGTLNALREHGLLYRLVPEFAGLHCLVQFEFTRSEIINGFQTTTDQLVALPGLIRIELQIGQLLEQVFFLRLFLPEDLVIGLRLNRSTA